MVLGGIIELSQSYETYQHFEVRMRNLGWQRKRFSFALDGRGFSKALHKWYDPILYKISPDFHPEYINEVWYKART